MGNIHTSGPNEALVISGGIGTNKKIIIGSWGWAWWCISDVQRMTLTVMTLNPVCERVETSQGVPLTVTGVAQVKVTTQEALLAIACEQFLGQDTTHVKRVLNQTLEGHLRSILGTLTVEAVYKDREAFANKVLEIATPDMGRMGMEILSFTIKEVYDDVEYLNSLGKSQTAVVRRDADIGVAEAERDAGVQEAACQKLAMDVKYGTDGEIADHKRNYEMMQSAFSSEINRVKAEAELAYELTSMKLRQKIREEEIQIDVVERRKQIEVETNEILRKEKELEATIKLPAESEAYRIQCIAEGDRARVTAKAGAEAERMKLLGGAEAAAIEAIGKAEASSMLMRAAAYSKYGNAAVTALTLEALPKIAAELAAPLKRTKEVVLIGGDNRLNSEVTKLVSTLPASVQALTGVDLTKSVANLMKASA